ncbi:MAG TPA: multiheme c-type cytochrome [Pirellulales bacterium]|nr:multiheme c-type cytochrome [Pirellulales bacterium]
MALLAAGAGAFWEQCSSRSARPQDAAQTPPDDTMIFGVVVAEGRPVSGATVRIRGRRRSVKSDSQGAFALPWPTDIEHGLSLTASKAGYFIGGLPLRAKLKPGQNVGALRLEPLPTEDCARYSWVDPRPDLAANQNCGNCHLEIYDEWRLDAHSRSARNRRLLNLYDGSDWYGRPGKSWSLLDEHPHGAGVCTSCHAPTVEPDDAAFDDLRGVSGVGAQGVHCDLCHKIKNVSVEHAGLAHGRFGLEWLRPSAGQLFFGPLDDVDRGEDVYSALQSQSQFCASCHEGIVFGVPVYTTYSEWLASPARREGKQCQTCHMKPTGKFANFAPDAGGLQRDPLSLASHQFLPGGRETMLKQCLQLSVKPAPALEEFRVSVSLASHGIGHSVPTGFIDRHLVLLLEVHGAEEQRLFARSGSVLPAAAGPALADQAGLLFAKLLQDKAGRSPAPFWRAGVVATDTRLRPEQRIEQSWSFPPTARKLRVRLWYRRFWPEVSAVKGWPDDSLLVFDRRINIEPARANGAESK